MASDPVAVAELIRRAKDAAEELDYFVQFARQQSEFQGDVQAGFDAAFNLRAACDRLEAARKALGEG